MKTYTITVELEEQKSGSGFIDSLLSEISEENRQLAITHKINEATSKIHNEVLQDLVNTLNEELGKVGLNFSKPEYNKGNSNRYSDSVSTIKFNHNIDSYALRIEGVSDRSFKESKYTTYTGKYLLKYNGSTVSNAEEIFSRMRDSVKKHINNQQL